MFAHLQHIFDALLPETSSQWFYLKLFHTEYWDGWSAKPWHILILAVVFVIAVLLFHGAFHAFDFSALRMFCSCRRGGLATVRSKPRSVRVALCCYIASYVAF